MTSAPMAPPPPPPPAPMAASAPAVPDARPTGVTVLAVLNAIGAVILLFGALGMMMMGGLVGSMASEGGGIFAMFGAALGVIFLLMAALYAAAAWGLWTRQRWAWYLAMVGVVLGIIGGITSFPAGILQLAIALFVGWYLLKPEVQSWFGLSYNVPWNKQTTT